MTALEDAPAASAPVTEGASRTAEEALALATQWANEQAARLTERIQNYLAKKNGQSNGGVSPRIGGPVGYDPSGNPYVAFDVVTTSPIQFIGQPPYLPNKVIATGNPAFLVAFIFTNPVSDPQAGFLIPANVQVGGQPWRMTLDQSNLTTGSMQPQQVATGSFGPGAVITPWIFTLDTSISGPDPYLVEANVTVYVDVPGNPYAAFATNFYDIDNDPAFTAIFPPIPPETAGWRFELPNRYLIYP